MKTPTEIVPAGLPRLIIQANELLIQANRLRDPPRLQSSLRQIVLDSLLENPQIRDEIDPPK